MQKKIVTFGEILMRLNPEGYFRFLQSSKFEVSYGGGEANVAVSLANYGMNATFVSKVPEHEIGQCAINELRRYGVDTKFVARGGNRLGVYFCEKGASQRVSKVIYDRENSSISQADPEDFNWDLIFDKADWFHWTGITPALGGRLPEICKAACKAAKERQIPISCDLNFRKKLWTRERANAVMQQLSRMLMSALLMKKMLRMYLESYQTEQILIKRRLTKMDTSMWPVSLPVNLDFAR